MYLTLDIFEMYALCKADYPEAFPTSLDTTIHIKTPNICKIYTHLSRLLKIYFPYSTSDIFLLHNLLPTMF